MSRTLRRSPGFCLFVRAPSAAVPPDWPASVYFTFQFYRFPPVTSQQLKLLTSDKIQQKSAGSLPCILASINTDGSVNSGKDSAAARAPWLKLGCAV